MKKNLKKVISAVIAMALSASTFASVSFAKSFSDVAGTAYAEAVDVLSALNIINGYEDGSFKPENTIKRSEAAKIIVAMVNKVATAEGRKGATKFDDVAADHWASGFINVGVSDKFINGKSETTFDPDGEVKYNEIVKMIVSCLGYDEYAQFYGGYPTGYIAIADSEGITKGCSMDGEAAATRGIVAQLVYNALNTPIIQSKGMVYNAAQGGFVPNIEKQDGEESTYYKSLLTEKFDAYYVQGTVTETPKSGDLDLDTVLFDIDKNKTEAYDEDLVDSTSAIAVLIGETAAVDYPNTYANAIIRVNEDEEYEFVSFFPSGKNKIATLDLALVDDDKYTATEIKDALKDTKSPYIYVYSSEDAARSSKYKLEKGFKLYVNGVVANDVDYDKYIINNHVGVLELTDTYGSEDGYDIVSVEYFDTTRVTSTSAKNIYIKKNSDGLNVSSISIDPEKLEDDEIVMNVYLNDEKVNASEIKKDDILSIKYNVNQGSDTSFYDIYVSRDTAEGKFSGLDTEDKLITIAGEKYASVEWKIESGKYAGEFQTNKMGNEYKVYLDVFGRIYTQEEVISTAKYAIALRGMTSSAWDNVGVKLFFTDGTTKNYEFATAVKDENGKTVDVDDLYSKLGTTNPKKADLKDRVVKYAVNTQGKISKITLLEAATNKTSDFDKKNSKIGNVIMNSTTTIIDAADYKLPADLTTASLDSLINDVEYEVYAYGTPSTTDNAYPFVLIVAGKGAYTEDTAFAVVTKDIYPSIKDDGEEGQMLEVLFEGSDEIQNLFVDEDAAYDNAKAGDVVVLQKNADGDVKEVKIIFSNANLVEEETFASALAKGKIVPPSADFETVWAPVRDKEMSLVFGPVVERNNRKFLAQVKDSKTYFDLEATKEDEGVVGATLDIITTDDTNVYVYDINAPRADRFYAGTADDIVATQVDHITAAPTEENEYYTINWAGAAADDQINFAFAKVVDGVVTDIFVIVGIE